MELMLKKWKCNTLNCVQEGDEWDPTLFEKGVQAFNKLFQGTIITLTSPFEVWAQMWLGRFLGSYKCYQN